LIHRTAASPNRELSEALEALLVSELVRPGRRLLIVSPWMTDFPVLDNRHAKYLALQPAWVAAWVPFSSVIRELLSRGTAVSIACGLGRRESESIAQIQDGAQADGASERLFVHRLPRSHRVFSHEKALVADTWAIYGSMNLTYSGVTMNGELVTVTSDPTDVASLATNLQGLFP
jgi:phosphatidylserine/phosphatidylglycerophosphate/cardiolipin synthase-like enzyme